MFEFLFALSFGHSQTFQKANKVANDSVLRFWTTRIPGYVWSAHGPFEAVHELEVPNGQAAGSFGFPSSRRIAKPIAPPHEDSMLEAIHHWWTITINENHALCKAFPSWVIKQEAWCYHYQTWTSKVEICWDGKHPQHFRRRLIAVPRVAAYDGLWAHFGVGDRRSITTSGCEKSLDPWIWAAGYLPWPSWDHYELTQLRWPCDGSPLNVVEVRVAAIFDMLHSVIRSNSVTKMGQQDSTISPHEVLYFQSIPTKS